MGRRVKEWFEPGRLTGLEVRLGQEGIELIYACTLQLSGDRLSVTQQNTGLKNAVHLAKHYKAQPVAICLTGKGILSKKVPSAAGISPQLISQVLPNANADEFYFQLDNQADHSMLSLIRRTPADELIKTLADLGFEVVSLSLGRVNTRSVPEGIKTELSLAYSAAFDVLLEQDAPEIDHALIRENRLQLKARAKFKGAAAVFGCTLLVLLLANFFLLGYFQEKAGKLLSRKNTSGQQVQKFQEMESDIVKKLALIRGLGWTGGYPQAWLTDRLMRGKPAAIVISKLTINPLKAQAVSAGNGEELYETGKMILSGSCDQAATLNNWLFELRSKDWVSECSVLNYEVSKESAKGEFTIEINIRDYEG